MGKFVKVAGIVWASLGALSLVSLAAYGSELGASVMVAGTTMLVVFVVPGVLAAVKGHRMIEREDLDFVAAVEANRQLQSQQQPERRERPCPWCAEPILEDARVCKHCGREVRPRELGIDA